MLYVTPFIPWINFGDVTANNGSAMSCSIYSLLFRKLNRFCIESWLKYDAHQYSFALSVGISLLNFVVRHAQLTPTLLKFYLPTALIVFSLVFDGATICIICKAIIWKCF